MYELDLVLSVALYGDKEQNTYDQAEHDEIDSRSQIIERYVVYVNKVNTVKVYECTTNYSKKLNFT